MQKFRNNKAYYIFRSKNLFVAIHLSVYDNKTCILESAIYWATMRKCRLLGVLPFNHSQRPKEFLNDISNFLGLVALTRLQTIERL